MIMKEMLKAYAKREPEIVFEWNDAETAAKGWVVINSLRGGAAGGGTRMHPRLDRRSSSYIEHRGSCSIFAIWRVCRSRIDALSQALRWNEQRGRLSRLMRKALSEKKKCGETRDLNKWQANMETRAVARLPDGCGS